MNCNFLRGDGLGDMRFECKKLKGFLVETLEVVLRFIVGCMFVVIGGLVYSKMEPMVVEGGIGIPP